MTLIPPFKSSPWFNSFCLASLYDEYINTGKSPMESRNLISSLALFSAKEISSSDIFSIAAFLALFSSVEDIKVKDNWYILTIPNKTAKVLINEFPCMIQF